MYTLKPLVLSIVTCLLVTGCNTDNQSKLPENVNDIEDTVIENGLVLAKTEKNFAEYYREISAAENKSLSTMAPTPTMTSPAADSAKVAASTSSSSISTTNLVEEGIDELDFVKQNTSHIFTTSRDKEMQYLKVFAKPSTTAIAQLDMPTLEKFHGLYLKDSQLFTLQQKSYKTYDYRYNKDNNTKNIDNENAQLEVDVIDIADPITPNISQKYIWDGHYNDSRRIGDNIFVVSISEMNAPQYCNNIKPMITQGSPSPNPQCQPAELTIEDIAERMPIDINGNKVKTSDCYIPSDNENMDFNHSITLITKIDLTGNEQHKTTCVASAANHVYMSPNAIYFTHSEYNQSYSGSTTHINQFSFNEDTDNGLLYNGNAIVPGSINSNTKKFSMNEHNNTLRVFTTSHVYNADSSIKNMFHTLTANTTGVSLEKLATIPNETKPKAIGKPNERIKSIRYMGDEAYVVTFRRTDPLYKLDLSVADDPKVAGELEMPGYSTYLQRINDKYLMGVGFSVDDNARSTGIQTTIFDTSNNDPVIVDQHTQDYLDSTFSNSDLHLPLDQDSRAITTLTDGSNLRVSVPYKLWHSSDKGELLKNNALEYTINENTGKIDRHNNREIVAPLFLKTIDIINKNDFEHTLNIARRSFYDINIRALMDGDEIYYTQFDGSLVKHSW